MIIGIGHDLTSIARMEQILQGAISKRFVERILTEQERAFLEQHVGQQRRAEYVAGRFAAKEAVSKAFGCGIGAVLGFQDIDIVRQPSGQPHCSLSEAAQQRLGIADKPFAIHLSITHEQQLASAYVIVEFTGR